MNSLTLFLFLIVSFGSSKTLAKNVCGEVDESIKFPITTEDQLTPDELKAVLQKIEGYFSSEKSN